MTQSLRATCLLSSSRRMWSTRGATRAMWSSSSSHCRRFSNSAVETCRRSTWTPGRGASRRPRLLVRAVGRRGREVGQAPALVICELQLLATQDATRGAAVPRHRQPIPARGAVVAREVQRAASTVGRRGCSRVKTLREGWGSVLPANWARSPHNQVSACITSVSTQGPLQYGIGVS